jgi:predicted O-methyltransferase YrrM
LPEDLMKPAVLRYQYLYKFLRLFRAFLLGFSFTIKIAIVLINRRAKKCKEMNDYLGMCFGIYGLIVRSIQIKEEITGLLKILAEHKTRAILEVGTAGGGTLFLFTRVAGFDATLISIDLPGGRFGGGYPKSIVSLYTSFSMDGQSIHLIRQNSHLPSTVATVATILRGRELDFVFIDGDHTYDGVKKDFFLYHKFLKKGGLLAFHDIVPGNPEVVGGVPRFWSEVKQSYRHVELVRDWGQGGCGIGVIYN